MRRSGSSRERFRSPVISSARSGLRVRPSPAFSRRTRLAKVGIELAETVVQKQELIIRREGAACPTRQNNYYLFLFSDLRSDEITR